MRRFPAILITAAIMLSLAVIPACAQGLSGVQLHGFMLNRMYFGEGDGAKFANERVSLNASSKVGDDGTAYVEVYFHQWMPDLVVGGGTKTAAEQYRTYLESAYVDLPLGAGRIRIGKGRGLNFGITPGYGNRKTTQYGILAETFTQDRLQGFQYYVKKNNMDFGVSLYTDFRIGNRKIGAYPGGPGANVVPHFVDKDDPANISDELGVSAKIGFSKPNFSAHISGARGQFRQDDANWIANQCGFLGTSDRDHNKYGVDFKYKPGDFMLQGEAYEGNLSFVKVKGYSLLVGYEPAGKNRAYLRYAAVSNDRAPLIGLPYTYDLKQLTFGYVVPIRKGVWAEIEYEKNWESFDQVDNDLFFVEFFTGF